MFWPCQVRAQICASKEPESHNGVVVMRWDAEINLGIMDYEETPFKDCFVETSTGLTMCFTAWNTYKIAPNFAPAAG